jgi:hypothetical protein
MSAVQFSDERFGICVDEQVDEARTWKASELERCIKTFIAANRQARLVAHSREGSASGAAWGAAPALLLKRQTGAFPPQISQAAAQIQQ